MSLHRNTMSPALLAVVLLSACGGGGNADGGGTAVSSSPNAPSVTTSQNAVANTTTETVTGQTTTAEAGNATMGSKAPSTTPTTPAGPSTPPATSAETATQTVGEKPPTSSANIASTVGAGSEATGNGTANTSGPQPTTQTEATRPEFFVPKKYLRGDVLLTMLDATFLPYSSKQGWPAYRNAEVNLSTVTLSTTLILPYLQRAALHRTPTRTSMMNTSYTVSGDITPSLAYSPFRSIQRQRTTKASAAVHSSLSQTSE